MMTVEKVFFLYSLYQFIQFAPYLEAALVKYLQAVNLILFAHASKSSVKMLLT